MTSLYEFLSLGRWGLSFSSWGVFCLAVFIVGFAKTGLPGITILAVPLVAMVFPPKISVGLMLPIYMLADVLSVWNYRRFAKSRYCLPYLLFVGLGVWSASFVAGAVDDRTFGVIIGWTVAVLVTLSAGTDFLQKRKKNLEPVEAPPLVMSAFFGMTAGLVSALANAAGPIMALYMILARLDKFSILGTTAVCSFFMNWFKVPLFLTLDMLSVETLKLDIATIPIIVLGGLAGIVFAKKLPQEAFKKLILVLALASSIKLILS
ncbi:MAG: sulfite exporter TauE/SafE family protein [Synergistaceae bacterium]|nr:sulfite exporter TauE/SafE family protein [Synergistaceae bacterium]